MVRATQTWDHAEARLTPSCIKWWTTWEKRWWRLLANYSAFGSFSLLSPYGLHNAYNSDTPWHPAKTVDENATSCRPSLLDEPDAMMAGRITRTEFFYEYQKKFVDLWLAARWSPSSASSLSLTWKLEILTEILELCCHADTSCSSCKPPAHLALQPGDQKRMGAGGEESVRGINYVADSMMSENLKAASTCLVGAIWDNLTWDFSNWVWLIDNTDQLYQREKGCLPPTKGENEIIISHEGLKNM